VKLNCANVVLFHYEAGTHQEVATWHDQVHRPSTHGMVPHVYYSQDWVAPADYVAARPANDLANRGGEYVTLFFSEGTREEYERDSRTATDQRNAAGRRHPHQDVVWRGRLNAVAAHARPDLEFAVDAVPLAPNTGLLIEAEELLDASRSAEYRQWRQRVPIARLMASGLFAACFECSVDEPNGHATDVRLFFVDRADPLAAFTRARELTASWTSGSDAFADVENVRREIFAAMYRTMPPGKYDFYV
jgi:hypothetical protein